MCNFRHVLTEFKQAEFKRSGCLVEGNWNLLVWLCYSGDNLVNIHEVSFTPCNCLPRGSMGLQIANYAVYMNRSAVAEPFM